MNTKIVKFIIVALIVVVLLTTTGIVYAQLGGTSDTYRIAIDQRGNLRLLDENTKGNFGNEIKDSEYLIELPSRQLINMLETRIAELEGIVEEQTSTLEASITELENTVVEQSNTISELENLDIQLGNTVLTMQNILSEVESTIDLLADTISELEDTANEQGNIIDVLGDRISSLEGIVTDLGNRVGELENNSGGSGNPGDNSSDTDYIPLDGLVFAERPHSGEVAPTTFEDMSGFGNDGALISITAVRLPSGLWVRSSSASSDITITDAESLRPPLYVTILFWIYQDSQNQNAGFVQKGGRGGVGCHYTIYTAADGDIFFGAALGGGWTSAEIFNDETFGVWEHYGVVYNGAAFIGYLNGTQKLSSAKSGVLAPTSDSNVLLMNDGQGTLGDMVLLKIWNRALSAEEIAEIYQSERHWFEP